MNEKIFKQKVSSYWPLFKKGLENNTPIYQTLLKMDCQQLRYLENESKDETQNAVVLYLAIMITAYPGNTIEVDSDKEDEFFLSIVNCLSLLATTACLEKKKLITCESDCVNLDPNATMKITMNDELYAP